MSDLPQQSYHEQERINNSSLTSASTDQQYQTYIEYSTLRMAIENEDKNSTQEIQSTDETVNLVDFLSCYVRITRCQVKCLYDAKKAIIIVDFLLLFLLLILIISSEVEEPVSVADIGRQIKEFQQEQELASAEQQNKIQSKEEEKKEETKEKEVVEYYYVDPYLDAMNPMNSMIIIDLPWPKPVESDTEE
ncbi:unnamed protein product [Rotaria magnacalcarata]|uniref:Uncharacterized protein n=1 Tax=Rotaria magnacalcarata TaxID=392030 RepID=A0A816U3U1_9BILA|nr:unnamed protein product [Rotaria magnacalcarata]CAF3865930.1 unnamed protein product [Rotaria magnacalcarata]